MVQVVLLLRLSPLLPLALSNYLYGLTSVDFVPYVLGSWLGQLPGTFAYVSAGEHAHSHFPSPPSLPRGGGTQWQLFQLRVSCVLTCIMVRQRGNCSRQYQSMSVAGGSSNFPSRI